MSLQTDLADSIEAKVRHAVSTNSGTWVEKGAAAIENFSTTLPDEGMANLARSGAYVLRENKQVLGKVVGEGFGAITSLVVAGKPDEAYSLWLRMQASFDEGQDAVRAAQNASMTRHASNMQTWEDVHAVIKRFAAAVGPLLLPVMLAAIGA